MSALLTARKRQGEAAEARFLAKATHLGLRVAVPWGDSATYDLIVDGQGKLSRVQLKSVWVRRSNNRQAYQVCVCRGNDRKQPYAATEVDFVVILVCAEPAWYIIPVRALAGRKAVRLASSHPQSRRRFEKYREAWQLFG